MKIIKTYKGSTSSINEEPIIYEAVILDKKMTVNCPIKDERGKISFVEKTGRVVKFSSLRNETFIFVKDGKHFNLTNVDNGMKVEETWTGKYEDALTYVLDYSPFRKYLNNPEEFRKVKETAKKYLDNLR